MPINNDQAAIPDYRIEAGNDGSVRGKVWIFNEVTRRISSLEFDAASWGDLQRLLYMTQVMKQKEVGNLVLAGPGFDPQKTQ